MKHANISVFIPHKGCPHTCSFCDQKIISGISDVTFEDIKSTLEHAVQDIKKSKKYSLEDTEIAFFGGSFTALPYPAMFSFLNIAKEYLEYGFKGIRISTRPDYITEEILSTLKSFGVTAVELGCQSMREHVLSANKRGHTAEDTRKSAKLIKSFGFELGLQMMVGLYKSTLEDEYFTASEIAKLSPGTVRVYPVVVLEGTELAALYANGDYRLLTFEEVTNLCGDLLLLFHENQINVIKCGLHASEFAAARAAAGFYHPAFRELAENAIYKKLIIKKLAETGEKSLKIAVAPRCISKVLGHGAKAFFEKNNVKIVADDALKTFEIRDVRDSEREPPTRYKKRCICI